MARTRSPALAALRAAVDRVLTIVVTATITSAAWIVFGATWLEQASEGQGDAPGNAAAPDQAMSDDPGGIEDAPPSPSDSASDAPIAGAEASEPPVNPPALRIPVVGVEAAELTDSFLDQRGPEGARVHEAIDIMAPAGTAVIAAAEGTIAKLHDSQAGGKTIYVRSPDRLMIYYYAHLDQYAPALREGQLVRAGERLGTVGSTGNAAPDAPHLHFALIETTRDARWWEPGTAINPYPLLAGRD